MLTLVYTPKAYSYRWIDLGKLFVTVTVTVPFPSWVTMFIRTALACRDQNRNCGRKQKLLATGQPAYTVKVTQLLR